MLLVAATLTWVIAADRPPDPLPATAPATSFSAERAHATLARLLGDGAPHPVGSPENAAVRERLLVAIRALGLEPETRTSFACRPEWGCATVTNVLARLPATNDDDQVALLLAHYDSVPAGPGAADDGSGTATLLETARALLAGPPLAHPVWLLWTDGEEGGLLGAEGFARSPEMARVGFVLNFEARGTSGRSLMFETGEENARAIGLLARHDPEPAANSVSFEIYRRLPNDTDYSVFKRAGVAGLNSAFVDTPLRYHTPNDSLDHLDLGSLQHHGDRALALGRVLGEKGVAAAVGGGRSTYFDLPGGWLVRWPEPWTLPLSLLAVAFCLVAARRARATWRWSGLAIGFLAPPISLAAAFGVAWGLDWVVERSGGLGAHWIAHPDPYRVAVAGTGVWVVAVLASFWRRRADDRGLALGVVLFWSLVSCLLASRLPGAAYVTLVPALVGALLLLLLADRSSAGWLAELPALIAAGLVFGGLAWFLPIALGMQALPFLAVGTALIASFGWRTLAQPGGRGARWLLGVGVVIAALVGRLEPRFTADQFEPCAISYVETAGQAQWTADPGSGSLPAGLARSALAAAPPARLYPWSRGATTFHAPAPRLDLALPELTTEAAEPTAAGVAYRLRLRSPRGATAAILRFAPEAKLGRLAVEGVEVGEPSARWAPLLGRGRALALLTLPPGGLEIEVEVESRDPVVVDVADRSAGLPPGAEELLAARAPLAGTIQRGDTTIVLTQVRLAP